MKLLVVFSIAAVAVGVNSEFPSFGGFNFAPQCDSAAIPDSSILRSIGSPGSLGGSPANAAAAGIVKFDNSLVNIFWNAIVPSSKSIPIAGISSKLNGKSGLTLQAGLAACAPYVGVKPALFDSFLPNYYEQFPASGSSFVKFLKSKVGSASSCSFSTYINTLQAFYEKQHTKSFVDAFSH